MTSIGAYLLVIYGCGHFGFHCDESASPRATFLAKPTTLDVWRAIYREMRQKRERGRGEKRGRREE